MNANTNYRYRNTHNFKYGINLVRTAKNVYLDIIENTNIINHKYDFPINISTIMNVDTNVNINPCIHIYICTQKCTFTRLR